MSCPSFEEKIARYAGGDLEPSEVRTVEAHLQQCAACAELAQLLEQDRDWLRSRPPEAVEVDYAAMRSGIRRGIVRVQSTRRWAWVLAAAAVVLVALGVGTMRQAPRPGMRVAVLQPAGGILEGATLPSAVQGGSRERQASTRVSTRHAGVRAPRSGDQDFALEEAMRMFADSESAEPPEESGSPIEMRIETRDPNVTITVVQESKGGSL